MFSKILQNEVPKKKLVPNIGVWRDIYSSIHSSQIHNTQPTVFNRKIIKLSRHVVMSLLMIERIKKGKEL